jgi:hypothetical protein
MIARLVDRSVVSIKSVHTAALDCKGTVNKDKGKGKALPLQAWTGPEGSSRLRLPDFNTIGT